MRERGYAEEFAHRILAQIRGFSDYGFPEAHAASFALLAYVSAWLKHHHPAAFTAALLNSQPMGFYQPAQLLRDARAHGVIGAAGGRAGQRRRLHAGGRWAAGPRCGWACVACIAFRGRRRAHRRGARGRRSFDSLRDLGDRAGLARHDMEALAAAGALAGFDGHRHLAFWQVAGYLPPLPPRRMRCTKARSRCCARPPRPRTCFADYRALGFTLGRHPLALLRERLAAGRY